MVRVLVPFSTDVLSGRANVYQTFKVCESFASNGCEVTLLVPLGWKTFFGGKKLIRELMHNYHITSSFNVCGVPVFRSNPFFPFSKINGMLFSLYSNIFALLYNPDILFTRDFGFSKTFYLLRKQGFFLKIVWIYEIHDLHFDQDKRKSTLEMEKKFFTEANVVIALTSHLKKAIVKIGLSAKKILVVPDGVDINLFVNINKSIARNKFGIKKGEKIVLYAGHLYKWKGVFVLAEAMKYVSNAICWIVGGLEEDQNNLKLFIKQNNISNVNLVGMVSPLEVPFYLKVADVLILPNSSENRTSKFYTSPLKLFEYMASGSPVIASDLPSIRDILNEKNSFLVKSDSPNALKKGIKQVLLHPIEANKRAQEGLKLVQKFSWHNRGKLILEKIQKFLLKKEEVK